MNSDPLGRKLLPRFHDAAAARGVLVMRRASVAVRPALAPAANDDSEQIRPDEGRAMPTRYDRWRDAHSTHSPKQRRVEQVEVRNVRLIVLFDGENKPASIRPRLVHVVPKGDAR